MQYKDFIENEVNNWYENLHNYSLQDKIQVIDILDADFVNNKLPTFNILIGISCTFKCCQEFSTAICQNSDLAFKSPISLTIEEIINKFLSQDIAKSITFQGLEPLDNMKQLLSLIYFLRKQTDVPVFIWTGYNERECAPLIWLIQHKGWKNIYIKFGRFVPNCEQHYDEILGVKLASNNQYAKQIS